MSPADPGLRLGRIGAWLNPAYSDDARTGLAIQAESLGFPTVWLGFGRAPVSDLALAERILDATSMIAVATAIVNMWTNDAADVAASYRRIAARHSGRFLLGIGIGHPESVTAYRQPYATMVNYLDQLDAGGVPPDRRILAALGPAALHLAAERTLGTHPYLVVPDHTRAARQMLGPGAVIAPEHKVVLDTDPDRARATGRAFVSDQPLPRPDYRALMRPSERARLTASSRLWTPSLLYRRAARSLAADREMLSLPAITAKGSDVGRYRRTWASAMVIDAALTRPGLETRVSAETACEILHKALPRKRDGRGTALAPEHGRRTLTGLRCEYRWEAPVRPEPRAQAAAGLRASRADRERVIDLLKAAFVQGRLDRDEFDARIGQAVASRTYGELAAVTADIPAELTGALPHRPPVRARRRIPFNTAVTGGACMAGVVNAGMIAVLLIRSPVAVVLFVVLTITGTILAIRAMIIAP